MSLLKYPRSLIIGKNNFISSSVKIHENVCIGNNNKIYDGTVIYPNTKIGNNNVILNNNILGEHGVEAKYDFTEKVFKGLKIGNNNYFHVNNIIFNGFHRKTLIGNNNKILAECHISHDTNIKNNVIMYPKSMTAGLTTLLDYSVLGMQSSIQQNSVLGHFSMIGMGNIASHNVFPFYIYFNQNYLRINKMKVPEKLNIMEYDNDLRNLIKDLKENKCYSKFVEKSNLPKDIKFYIEDFLNYITIKKV
mgnify:FL=1|jgi:acyl-[acyl carrier protein]--UDP-N-acetylglucosamine O-acyltransferase